MRPVIRQRISTLQDGPDSIYSPPLGRCKGRIGIGLVGMIRQSQDSVDVFCVAEVLRFSALRHRKERHDLSDDDKK